MRVNSLWIACNADTIVKFGGDLLQLQTFWDSFETAIHNNDSLTGVQRFHYQHTQLLGDTSCVIDNLHLIDLN